MIKIIWKILISKLHQLLIYLLCSNIRRNIKLPGKIANVIMICRFKLINMCLSASVFPNLFVSILSKIYEKSMSIQINKYFESFRLLTGIRCKELKIWRLSYMRFLREDIMSRGYSIILWKRSHTWYLWSNVNDTYMLQANKKVSNRHQDICP